MIEKKFSTFFVCFFFFIHVTGTSTEHSDKRQGIACCREISTTEIDTAATAGEFVSQIFCFFDWPRHELFIIIYIHVSISI